ncbi:MULTISPECIES: hypothetical protein [Paenibacillus]|uniref:Uncharacterized protein n=1 Tax=Paenibacillus borealis TaxID=160799 RepID=A0ABX3HHA0_PAEBO|nr:hypothetical protein [Paenibacillus borealis]OMD49087.1 hypothetical protein BSK56_09655 [Paenibacillus borealis]
MTFKQAISLRNILIILCTFILILLGQKAFRIEDKIQAVHEGDRLYAAGDLISAENQYRLAAANPSILYKEEEVAAKLKELAPITAIRSGLKTLVLKVSQQLDTKDFTGFMESYAALLSLKTEYMQPGGSYESYYRQLSADSGLSGQFSAGFQQFKSQFLTELGTSQSGSGNEDSGDSFKWNLLRIPDTFYGGSPAKEKLLAGSFQAHDTVKLKELAAAGSFDALLDSALSMMDAYKSHTYNASWVQEQAEASAKKMLGGDLDSDSYAAFTGHAVSYRKFAASASLDSSKVLTLIDSSLAKLMKSAARLVRGGQYAEAVQLYSDLTGLQDTTEDIAAARIAWNAAEPVRLLPGGEEQGKYAHVVSVTGRYGAKVAVAGTDSSGVLYFADMSEDGIVSTRTGEVIAGFENLRNLAFDDKLSALSEVPVVVAESSREDGRTSFTAYQIKPEGISQLFSFAGNSYTLQPDDDHAIFVENAIVENGGDGLTAVYRLTEGVYQFSEIHQEQEYPQISAIELELHPFEKVTLHCDIYIDSSGRSVASSDGRLIVLQGNTGSVTGLALVSGQFLNSFEYVETDTGMQYLPVFVADSLESMSLVLP